MVVVSVVMMAWQTMPTNARYSWQGRGKQAQSPGPKHWVNAWECGGLKARQMHRTWRGCSATCLRALGWHSGQAQVAPGGALAGEQLPVHHAKAVDVGRQAAVMVAQQHLWR